MRMRKLETPFIMKLNSVVEVFCLSINARRRFTKTRFTKMIWFSFVRW